MLTKLIVDLYGWIIEIFLWFILLHPVLPVSSALSRCLKLLD